MAQVEKNTKREKRRYKTLAKNAFIAKDGKIVSFLLFSSVSVTDLSNVCSLRTRCICLISLREEISG